MNDGPFERQKIIADFCTFALHSNDLDAVLAEACRLVGKAFGTGPAAVVAANGRGTAEDGTAALGAAASAAIILPGGATFGTLQIDAAELPSPNEQDRQFLATFALILGPIIDRLVTAAARNQTEERYRLIVESAHDYAILQTDTEDRITDWLPGAEAVFGWSAEEIVGQQADILFTPEDRAAGVPRREVDAARRIGITTDIRWHVRKDGSRVFIDGSVTALRNRDGSLGGFQKVGKDATDQRLEESRQQFMLNLADELRTLADSGEIQNAATRCIAEHFGVTRLITVPSMRWPRAQRSWRIMPRPGTRAWQVVTNRATTAGW
jgi:PAS domain S-box-containing protein